jgi:hypothetical protein
MNERAGDVVANFINNNMTISCKDGLFDDDGKIEACAIELYAGQDKILIVSCYKQPQMKIDLTVWRTFVAQFKCKFFIGGDFNEHRHSWGNSKNCTTANNLYHCITELETNITLLNDGSQTYISDVTKSKAILDLSFVDPRLALLYSWKVGAFLGIATIIQLLSSITAK